MQYIGDTVLDNKIKDYLHLGKVNAKTSQGNINLISEHILGKDFNNMSVYVDSLIVNDLAERGLIKKDDILVKRFFDDLDYYYSNLTNPDKTMILVQIKTLKTLEDLHRFVIKYLVNMYIDEHKSALNRLSKCLRNKLVLRELKKFGEDKVKTDALEDNVNKLVTGTKLAKHVGKFLRGV